MAHQSTLITNDIHTYLKQHEKKSLLRFITCGSVDDGKSTLIGRLLWDSKMIFEDQLAALKNDSRKCGTQGEEIDYALLLDGLQAEQEQGITIDVAYRFFSTGKRKFIVADTPGHEQYTRNMVTGASTAQVAVILVDARKGVLTQTRRHSYLTSLVGIQHIVLAINKMDLVDYDQQRFESILKDYLAFASELGFDSITAIPISALKGVNILHQSRQTPWYAGPTLMDYLESVQIADGAANHPFRMQVQWVNRPHLDFRGFCGNIASGTVRPGDELIINPSGKKSRVKRIVTMDGDLRLATAGQAVTLILDDEIDISRGDLLAGMQSKPHCADRFEAKLVWLHDEPLLPDRSYLIKAGSAVTPGQIISVDYKININTLRQEPGKALNLNEIGVCRLSTNQPLPFDTYDTNRETGSFIIIDRLSDTTVGAGMISKPHERITANHWQASEVCKQTRAAIKEQTPKVLCFTGSPNVGNLNVANLVEKKLHSIGKHTYILNDDNLSHGLNRDLGDTGADQIESVRRIAEVAKILLDAGIIVLIPLAQLMQNARCRIRELFPKNEFVEIHLNTPASICGQRENKELIPGLGTGKLDAIPENASVPPPPGTPGYTFDVTKQSAKEIALLLVEKLFEKTSCQERVSDRTKG